MWDYVFYVYSGWFVLTNIAFIVTILSQYLKDYPTLIIFLRFYRNIRWQLTLTEMDHFLPPFFHFRGFEMQYEVQLMELISFPILLLPVKILYFHHLSVA